MAIETGAIFKKLYFDGQSSGDYGVYISGAGTFNAPVRDIEMVSIPGRNGALALDKGRFENIEVTYKAGLFGVDEADFADAISDFRNFLCSRSGYVRLEDDYNPDEYRMAVYKNGLNVDLATLEAGEFDITFDCKPQRWLKSGEAAVTVASGDTLTNPTLFESSPLLEVEGYGTIELNGYEIELNNEPIGEVNLVPFFAAQSNEVSKDYSSLIGLLGQGDVIEMDNFNIVENFSAPADRYSSASASFSSIVTENIPNTQTPIVTQLTDRTFKIAFPFGAQEFAKGTDYSAQNVYQFTFSATTVSNSSVRATVRARVTLSNTGNGVLSVKISFTGAYATPTSYEISCSSLIGISTLPALGNPTYIDCDYGEAYKMDGTGATSLNKYINLGSDLPKLASGENEVTFDNTVTELKVHPRWWKI